MLHGTSVGSIAQALQGKSPRELRALIRACGASGSADALREKADLVRAAADAVERRAAGQCVPAVGGTQSLSGPQLGSFSDHQTLLDPHVLRYEP